MKGEDDLLGEGVHLRARRRVDAIRNARPRLGLAYRSVAIAFRQGETPMERVMRLAAVRHSRCSSYSDHDKFQ
jgi:hypothetical protein